MRTFIGVELSRGVAALMVMLCHYAYMVTDGRTVLNFLWTGVDLFFVISGFLFAKLIISSKIDLKHFFIRRFFRIYPLYFLALIMYFLLTEAHSEKLNYFFNHLLFLQTTSSLDESIFFNSAFWSLPVEVEFYLAVPLLAYLMRLKHALIAIFIFSLCLKLWITLNSTPNIVDIYMILGFHLSGLLPEFLVGVILYKAVVYTDFNFIGSKFKLCLSVACIGCLSIFLLAVFFIRYGDQGLNYYKIFGGFYNILCAISYAFILFSLSFLNTNNMSKRLINAISFIGSISYPVYLLHNASPEFSRIIGFELDGLFLFLLCTVITLIASIVLHKAIEEPSRLYGRSLSKRFMSKKCNSI